MWLPLCWNEVWAGRGEEAAMTASLRLKLGEGVQDPEWGRASGFLNTAATRSCQAR